jgi:hypothetical protein
VGREAARLGVQASKGKYLLSRVQGWCVQTPSDAGDALTPTALTLGDPSTTPSAVDKPRRKWSLGRRASSKELNRTGSK